MADDRTDSVDELLQWIPIFESLSLDLSSRFTEVLEFPDVDLEIVQPIARVFVINIQSYFGKPVPESLAAPYENAHGSSAASLKELFADAFNKLREVGYEKPIREWGQHILELLRLWHPTVSEDDLLIWAMNMHEKKFPALELSNHVQQQQLKIIVLQSRLKWCHTTIFLKNGQIRGFVDEWMTYAVRSLGTGTWLSIAVASKLQVSKWRQIIALLSQAELEILDAWLRSQLYERDISLDLLHIKEVLARI